MEKENFAQYIVESLGGTAATAKFFGIKMPSVCEWVEKKQLPRARVRHLQDVRPDLFPCHAFEANNASKLNHSPRPIENEAHT